MFSPRVKVAVCDALAPDDTDWPMPTASDDENASTSIMPGWCLSRPCLTASLNITPDEATRNRLARSQRPGFSSRALSMGLPKASPTMAIWFTRSRSIVSNISMTSNLRAVSVTELPPSDRMMSCV